MGGGVDRCNHLAGMPNALNAHVTRHAPQPQITRVPTGRRPREMLSPASPRTSALTRSAVSRATSDPSRKSASPKVGNSPNTILIRLTACALQKTVADWTPLHSSLQAELDELAAHPQHSPPLIAQQLLISAEDHRHGGHSGFDSIAICRALWRRLTSRRREGASTIEQQLVRTITGRRERTLDRKLVEIKLAILVDQHFPKATHPALYLSLAYYGWRMNGYRQACHRLQFQPRNLTLHQAAALVARLKYPEPRHAPASRIQQIRRRTRHLITLYRRHVHDGTYRHLYDETLPHYITSVRPQLSLSHARRSAGRTEI